MKNLLTITKILILSFVVAQNPDSMRLDKKSKVETTQVDTSSTNDQIKNTLIETKKNIEEIRQLKIKNDLELIEIKKIENTRKELKKSNFKLLDLILKRKKITTTPSKTKIIYVKSKSNINNTVDVKIDSTCISYSRDGLFSKKKCDKYEYFKYITDTNDDKIILK